jgi:CBS domain-containing protein
LARISDVMSMRVVTVRPDDSVQLAIGRMLEENVGSVAVCAANELVGIFTERDVLRMAGEGTSFGDARVGDVMTRSPVTVSPDDDVLAAARLMGERRIRHLPVVEAGNVLGLVGIRDVMRTLVERLWREHDPEARETARALLSRGGQAEVPSASAEGV